MENIDLTKLDIAIKYIDRIADGRNPVNNTPVNENDALNNPNIIRCMYFIKDVLETVRRNGGVIGGRGKAAPAVIPPEALDAFVYQEDKSITHLMKQIYEPVQDMNIKKISFMKVTTWLKEEGYLKEAEKIGSGSKQDGRAKNVPTEKGIELGLYLWEREYEGRMYQTVMYDKQAQEYVVERMRREMEHN